MIPPWKWSNAKQGYREFHHGPPESHRRVWANEVPPELFVIGRAIAVIYLPYGGSRKPHDQHIHRFGDYGEGKKVTDPRKMPILAGGPDGELYILRDRSEYYLDNRGIVG